MKRRQLWPLLLPLVITGSLLLFLGATHLIRGLFSHHFSKCGILQTTGYYCPGCGGTRCAHDLAAGNWLSALGHHVPLTVGVFTLGALCLYLVVRITILGKPAPRLPNISTPWLWTGLSLLVIFTILRNIPTWPFSLLAP